MRSSSVKAFHTHLHNWYTNHGRHSLPWRQTKNPYHIYISEVMLQQTQVKTVLERFYFPFLEVFPTLQALAEAPEDAVMKQWEGLGYYSRARNLHKAAKQAAPALPDDYETLLALPGIGQNTAHAIMAFAYGRPYPVLEANVKRVVHRIFALETATPAELWEKAETLLNRDEPFDYNQAMMDLGSQICLPKTPLCLSCPAKKICKGKSSPERYPAPKSKKVLPARKKQLIVLCDANGRYYLTARTTRFLGGLYGFIELDEDKTHVRFAGHEYAIHEMQPLEPIKQTYSHFQLQAQTYLCPINDSMNSSDWHSLEEIDQLPLSKADIKLRRQLPASDAHVLRQKVVT